MVNQKGQGGAIEPAKTDTDLIPSTEVVACMPQESCCDCGDVVSVSCLCLYLRKQVWVLSCPVFTVGG